VTAGALPCVLVGGLLAALVPARRAARVDRWTHCEQSNEGLIHRRETLTILLVDRQTAQNPNFRSNVQFADHRARSIMVSAHLTNVVVIKFETGSQWLRENHGIQSIQVLVEMGYAIS